MIFISDFIFLLNLILPTGQEYAVQESSVMDPGHHRPSRLDHPHAGDCLGTAAAGLGHVHRPREARILGNVAAELNARCDEAHHLRAAVEEATHIAWAIAAVADNGWEYVRRAITGGLFLVSGTLGTVAVAIMLIQPLSYIRYASYETFLNIHTILVTIAFVCTWAHCTSASSPPGLPELSWIMANMVLWFADRLARVIRLAHANWSRRGFTYAIGEPMSGEVIRVTLTLPNTPLPTSEKEPFAPLDQSNVSTAVSFIVGAQMGMTHKLFIRASQAGRSIRLKAAFEGPYAGRYKLDSYGHAVLFAGSTGIIHQLLYIRHLVEGYNAGTVATRRVTLIWIIREYKSLEWVPPYMDTILSIPHQKDILCLHIFITRLRYPRDITNTSTTVRIYTGRPNVMALLAKEIEEQAGAMCVTVCGPGGLADNVRGTVCAMQAETVVEFVEESFTW
ncbi:Ferric cupric reductase transmembrane component 2 [Fusarium acutatum]|uniref:Ferric cupric reductase transmembrane component 2 n=1 Tax=Fusarium acutatum TaxID=78861 RepID=A0A8H4NIC8_9HYPO|nr:Ferric cupric reductase transmembrane component 2 [Fusarium acutatum]